MSTDREEARIVISPQRPIDIKPIFYNGVLDDRFSSHGSSALVEIDIYKNVIFDSSTSVLRNSDGLIKETRYLIDDLSVSNYNDENIIDLTSAGMVCVGFNRPGRSHNYYHWINQCVPAIYSYSMLRAARRPLILLPKSLSVSEARFFDLLKLDADFLYVDGFTKAKLSEVAFSNYLLGCADYRPSNLLSSIFKEIAILTKDMPFVGYGKRLYVSRQDSALRKVINEDEIVELMAKNDFSILRGSEMTVDEQICAFSRADVVIGPHGAGLANILFCKPGTIVIEFAAETYVNPCFVTMAHGNNLEYYLETMPLNGIQQESNGHQQNWRIDVNRLRSLMQKLLPKKTQTFLASYLKPTRLWRSD